LGAASARPRVHNSARAQDLRGIDLSHFGQEYSIILKWGSNANRTPCMEAKMVTRAKVLIIDDDQDYRNSVRCLLESHGYEAIEADSGKDGLRKVAENKPEVILLDVMMECDSEGYSVTHAIKHQDAFADCRDIPIIMVSSIQESPDELFPMAPERELIRPDRYIAKPLDAPVLLEALEKALGPRRSHEVPSP